MTARPRRERDGHHIQHRDARDGQVVADADDDDEQQRKRDR
jgi:hypothetical protein